MTHHVMVRTWPPGWPEVQAECERLGWPKHYRGDLDMDLACLEKYPCKVFGWGVRECGTDIFIPSDEPTSGHWTDFGAKTIREWAISWARAQAAAKDPGRKFYWWDGKSLKPVTLEKLIRKLIEHKEVQA